MSSNNSVTAYNIPVGGAKFTWTVERDGCSDFKTYEVSNGYVEAALNSTNPLVICDPDEAVLTAKSIEAYTDAEGTWVCTYSSEADITKEMINAGGYIQDPNSASTSVQGLAHGTFKFQWQVTNGTCVMKSEELEVVNKRRVAVAEVGKPDQAIINTCLNNDKNEYYTLNATADYSDDYEGEWTVSGGTIADEDKNNPKAKLTGIAANGFATLTWKVTNKTAPEECPASGTITVRNNFVKANASQNGIACGGAADLIASYDNTISTLEGEWSTVGGDDSKFDGDLKSTNIKYDLSDVASLGTVTIRWTITNKVGDGCSNYVDLKVVNYDYKLSAGYDHNTNCTDEFTLSSAYAPAEAECWWESNIPGVTFSLGDGEDNKIAGSEVAKTVASGLTKSLDHTFTLHADYNGCSKTANVVITDNNVDDATINPVASVTCEANVNLSANLPSAGKGTWTTSPTSITYTSGTNTDNVVTVSNLPENSTAKFTWTVANEDGSCPHVSETVEVLNKHYENSIVTKDQTICNNTITLDAKDVKSVYDVKGWWTTNNTTVSAAIEASSENPTIKVTLPENATVSFTWHAQYTNEESGLICPDDYKSVDISNETLTVTAAASDDYLQGDKYITCDNKVELVGSVLPSGGEGEWVCVGGIDKDDVTFDSKDYYKTYARNLKSGDYQFRWVVSSANEVANPGQGCKKESNLLTVSANGFQVDADKDADDVTKTREVCNNIVTVQPSTAKTGSTVEWSGASYTEGVNGAIIVDMGDKTSVRLDYKETSTNGCYATDYVTLINVQPEATADLAYNTCDGTAELKAGNILDGTKGYWEKVSEAYSGSFSSTDDVSRIEYDGVNKVTIYNIKNNSETKLRYVVEAANNPACSNSVEATVINHKFIPEIKADAFVCDDKLVIEGTMPSYGTYTGAWAGSGLTFEPVKDGDNSKVTVKGLAHGENKITWTVTDAYGCAANVATTTIDNIVPGVAEITLTETEKEVCENEVTLKTRELEDHVIGKWTTTSSAVVKGSNTNETTTTGTEVEYTNLNGNNNTFFWTIYREGHEDCHSDANVVIVNNHIEAGNILNKSVTCDGTIELEADAIVDAQAKGKWTSSTGLEVTDGTAQNKATAEGIAINETQKFIWTVTKGYSGKCFDTKEVEVTNYQADATINSKKADNSIACASTVELVADAISHMGDNVHGQWTKELMMSGANNVVITNDGSNRAEASNLDITGKYVFHWNVWREVDGEEVCRNFAELTVNNSMLAVDADTQVPDGESASACGDEYVLHGQTISGTEGEWTIKSGDETTIEISDIHDANATVKGVPADGVTPAVAQPS